LKAINDDKSWRTGSAELLGPLLGIAAESVGSCDMEVLRMITVHLPVMLPVHTTPVDIPREQQIAALVSLSLLYTGSGSAYIAGILLKEIGLLHQVQI